MSMPSDPNPSLRRLTRPDPPALAPAATELALPHAARQRSRMRWHLPAGGEIAWQLPAGQHLQPGDLLQDPHGHWFRVSAAAEPVLQIQASDARQLACAAYHLGNRHIPVEIGATQLAIEPDPVLRAMLEQLGLSCRLLQAPFQPEAGAYAGGHRHGHEASFAQDYALAQAVYVRHQDDPA